MTPNAQLRIKPKPSNPAPQCRGGVTPSPIPPPEPGAPYVPSGSPNQRVMGKHTDLVRHLGAGILGVRGLGEASVNIQCIQYCTAVVGLSIPYWFSTNGAGACVCSESGALVYGQDYQVRRWMKTTFRNRCLSLPLLCSRLSPLLLHTRLQTYLAAAALGREAATSRLDHFDRGPGEGPRTTKSSGQLDPRGALSIAPGGAERRGFGDRGGPSLGEWGLVGAGRHRPGRAAPVSTF